MLGAGSGGIPPGGDDGNSALLKYVVQSAVQHGSSMGQSSGAQPAVDGAAPPSGWYWFCVGYRS